MNYQYDMSWCRSLGIVLAKGWVTRVCFLAGAEIARSCTLSGLALGPSQPSTQWVSLAVKLLGHEADHLRLPSAEV
jgi:hypothetical protein